MSTESILREARHRFEQLKILVSALRDFLARIREVKTSFDITSEDMRKFVKNLESVRPDLASKFQRCVMMLMGIPYKLLEYTSSAEGEELLSNVIRELEELEREISDVLRELETA